MPSPDLTAEERAPSDLLAQGRTVVRRVLPWLLALVLLSGALAGGLTRLQPKTYVSTVSFVVQSTGGASDSETLIRTMQALVGSEIIGADLARSAAPGLTASAVTDRVSVLRPPGAGVFTVEVSDTDEARSRRLAEQLIPVFQRRVAELTRPEPGEVAVTYSIRPWGSGAVDTRVAEPPVLRNTVLGLVLGALLSLLLLALRAATRPVLLTPAQARAAYRLPLLGAVPTEDPSSPDPADVLDVLLRPSPVTGWPASPRRVLVVGAPDLRDRAVLLVDLACSLQSTRPVAVVDAHGGQSSLSRLFNLRKRPGLSDALAAEGGTTPPLIDLREVAAAGEPTSGAAGTSVRILPFGTARTSSAQSPRLAALVHELEREHLVVVDTPLLTGPLAWGPLLRTVDAVLVLAALGRTPVAEARATGDALLAMTDRPAAVLLLNSDRLLVPAAAASELRPPGELTAEGHVLSGRPAAPDGR